MDSDEYALTEAEVLDTLQLVVAAEQYAAATASTPVSLDDSPVSLDAPAAKPYQNRQKQELDYLKTKVRELERELQQLERANDAKFANVDDTTWQRVAQQQLVEKQKAMSENARLRADLDGQLKFAKTLERVLRKRPNLTAFGSGDNEQGRTVRRRKTKERHASTNARVFDELLEACEREFQRTDEALTASGVAGVLRDRRCIDVKVMDDDDNVGSGLATNDTAVGDLRVDWTIVRRYPFPFHAVAHEIWKLLAYNSVSSHIAGIDRTVEQTDDTLFATTTFSLPLGQHVCTLSAAAVIRQYVTEDSVIVVWVSDGECESDKSAKDTFKLYEVGWIKLQAVPDDPSSCISHTLGYYFPTFSPRTSPSSSPSESESAVGSSSGESHSLAKDIGGVGLLTELLGTVYEKSASQIHTAVENALMAEAVGQSKTVADTA